MLPCRVALQDGTLVNTRSGLDFPKDAADWKFFNKTVADVLRKFHAEGYKLVVFSNQGAIKGALDGKGATKTKERMALVVGAIGVPMQVFFSTMDGPYRKPNRGMWDWMVENCNAGIGPDMAVSFFVGDAAGRLLDFADTDKAFAATVGIEFKVPEDVFGEMEGKKQVSSGQSMARWSGCSSRQTYCSPLRCGHNVGRVVGVPPALALAPYGCATSAQRHAGPRARNKTPPVPPLEQGCASGVHKPLLPVT